MDFTVTVAFEVEIWKVGYSRADPNGPNSPIFIFFTNLAQNLGCGLQEILLIWKNDLLFLIRFNDVFVNYEWLSSS